MSTPATSSTLASPTREYKTSTDPPSTEAINSQKASLALRKVDMSPNWKLALEAAKLLWSLASRSKFVIRHFEIVLSLRVQRNSLATMKELLMPTADAVRRYRAANPAKHHPLIPLKKSTHSPRPMAFTLFPKLPTELRLQIWRFSLPAANFIQIHTSWNAAAYENWNPTHVDDTLRCVLGEGRVVDLLSACRESREVMEEFYRPLLKVPRTPAPAGPRVRIWGNIGLQINFEKDNVFIGPHGYDCLYRINHRLDISGIRNISLSLRFVSEQAPGPAVVHGIVGLLRNIRILCPRLRRLRFIVGMEPAPNKEDLRFVSVDSNLEDMIDYIEQRDRDVTDRRHKHLYILFRRPLILAKVAKAVLKRHVKRHALEWDNIRTDVCFIARRATGASHYNIRTIQRGMHNGSPVLYEKALLLASDDKRADRYEGIKWLFEGRTLVKDKDEGRIVVVSGKIRRKSW